MIQTRHMLAFIAFSILFFTLRAFGQDFDSGVTLFMEPAQGDWQDWLQLLRDKPATFFTITFIAVQLLFMLARTALGDILGIHKLLVLALLNVFATIMANVSSGKSWLHSLVGDAGSLMAYQVLFSQCQIQWRKRAEDCASLPDTNICNRRGLFRRKTKKRLPAKSA